MGAFWASLREIRKGADWLVECVRLEQATTMMLATDADRTRTIDNTIVLSMVRVLSASVASIIVVACSSLTHSTNQSAPFRISRRDAQKAPIRRRFSHRSVGRDARF